MIAAGRHPDLRGVALDSAYLGGCGLLSDGKSPPVGLEHRIGHRTARGAEHVGVELGTQRRDLAAGPAMRRGWREAWRAAWLAVRRRRH